ncbi:MAG TPA: metallophosphoesterase family protein [Candidatus Bathyarchaeia archaeon]|nr:metallophosphoesterase family protein [Candidatus Bathyarchaeia archaeon]
MNMKIGILSDTHLPKKGKQFPVAVLQGLQEADLIIHAGDWSSMEVYEELSQLAPVKGVYGNIETEDILVHFPQKLLLELAGYRIGVVHGDKGKGKTTPDRALSTFANEKVDLIIFGHSHIPFHETRNGVILFNPGSPTDKRRQPAFSYGWLEVGEKISLQHHFFHEKKPGTMLPSL